MKDTKSSSQLTIFAKIDVKLCPRCGLQKPWSAFSKRSATLTMPCSYCKVCQREYCKQHYRVNKGVHNFRRYKRNKLGRKEIANRIQDYKREKCCIDCGEADPVVLEFDHVRGLKHAEIGVMVWNSTWEKIAEEIAKCELRCANCHRRKTAIQLGWKNHRQFSE